LPRGQKERGSESISCPAKIPGIEAGIGRTGREGDQEKYRGTYPRTTTFNAAGFLLNLHPGYVCDIV